MEPAERLVALEKGLSAALEQITNLTAKQIQLESELVVTDGTILHFAELLDLPVDEFEKEFDERKKEALRETMFGLEDINPAVAAVLQAHLSSLE